MASFVSTAQDDTISGTNRIDIFTASTGNDVFDGGNESDLVVYKGSMSEYQIEYLMGELIISKPDGSRDILTNIEQVRFGALTYSVGDVRITPTTGEELTHYENYIYPSDFEISSDGSPIFLQDTPNWGGTGAFPTLWDYSEDLSSQSSLSLEYTTGYNGQLVKVTDNEYFIVRSSNANEIEFCYYNSTTGNSQTQSSATYIGLGFLLDSIVDSSDPTALLLACSTGLYRLNAASRSIEAVFVPDGSGPLADLKAIPLEDGSILVLYMKPGGIVYDDVLGASYYDQRIYAQLISSNGTLQGDKIELGGSVQITDAYLTASLLDDGTIFVGWVGLDHVFDPEGGINTGGQDVSQLGYFNGTFFNPADGSVGTPFQLNLDPSTNVIWTDSVSLSNGNLAVVWASNSDGSGTGIYARIYDSSGTPITDPFQVNSNTWGNQTDPMIRSDGVGGFFCYWSDEYNGGVFQRFDVFGNPLLLNITGTVAADRIVSNAGMQQITSGRGNDTVDTGLGDDIIVSGAGNDSLFGGSGNDIVDAGRGNDLIVGGHGEGDDAYFGGTGIDTIRYTSALSGITVNLATGTATSVAGGDLAGIGIDTLSSIENVIAGSFADIVIGDSADNSLNGGSDADTLVGGTGNDLYITDGADTITELLAEGTDTVRSSATYTLAENLELLELSGTSAINGTGNTLANRLTGNKKSNILDGLSGADTLFGGGGNDWLIGGADKDILTGGTGVDQFVFSTESESSADATSADVITDFVRGTDKISLSAIDAFASSTTNDTFVWRGTSAFSRSTSGEVRYQKYDNKGSTNDYTMVFIDTDADTGVEMSIRVNGLHTFASSDFIL